MNETLVLCYHAVSPGWSERVNVPPDALERQLRILLRRGYRPATYTEAVLAPPHRRTLAVTFDDAYRSVAVHARPVLDALGVPATVFAPTRWVGDAEPMSLAAAEWRGTRFENELACMGWDELRALADAGWEIGSHTVTHPMLTHIARDDALREELTASRATLEQALGRPCRALAYPYGDFDARVARAAREAGYETACTLFPGLIAAPRAHEVPRVAISRHHGDRAFAVKTSRTVRRIRTLELPGPVERALYRLRPIDPPKRPGADA